MVGVPIGTEEYTVERVVGVVRGGVADHLVRFPAEIPDKQSGTRASHLEQALPREACRRENNGAQWAPEQILKLPGEAQSQPFL